MPQNLVRPLLVILAATFMCRGVQPASAQDEKELDLPPADSMKEPFDRDVGTGEEAPTVKVGPDDIVGIISEPNPVDERLPGLPLGDLPVSLVNARNGIRLVETKTDAFGRFNLGRHEPSEQYLIVIGRGFVQGKIIVEEKRPPRRPDRIKIPGLDGKFPEAAERVPGAPPMPPPPAPPAPGELDGNEPLNIRVTRSVAEGFNPVMLTDEGKVSDVNTYTTGEGNFRGSLKEDDGNTAIPNMPIRILDREDGSTLLRTETDKDGLWNFPDLKQGTYVVAVGQATLYFYAGITPGAPNTFLQLNTNLNLLQSGYVGTVVFDTTAPPVIIPIGPGAAIAAAAIVATAVAVPTTLGIALTGDDDPEPGSGGGVPPQPASPGGLFGGPPPIREEIPL